MNGIFDLLRQKERRFLTVLTLLLALILLFDIFIARGMKNTYTQTAASLRSKTRVFQELDQVRQEAKREWRRWRLAYRDIDQLKEGYFYTAETIAQDMRRDIAQLFQETGLPVPDIRYAYISDTDQKIGGETATFQISGPYSLIKRFIHTVEHFPRFLIIEQIDFVDVQRQSQALRLKITLGAYYGL